MVRGGIDTHTPFPSKSAVSTIKPYTEDHDPPAQNYSGGLTSAAIKANREREKLNSAVQKHKSSKMRSFVEVPSTGNEVE